MFKHLSLQEKIELLLGTRTSGGGLPLPEAFGAALSYLHDKGTTPDDVLRKIIRDKRQVEFREPRILEVCDDWDSFTAVILDGLENAELITREDDSWSLTENAIPGKDLTILRVYANGEDRRARVRFFGEQHRQDRNKAEVFKGEIEGLVSRVQWLSYLSPAARETVSRYLLACSQVLREALGDTKVPPLDLPPLPRGKRRFPGQARWYREWIRTAEWHTMNQALEAWNEEHPLLRIESVSNFSGRNEANILLQNGKMERREVSSGRDFFEYRYLGD